MSPISREPLPYDEWEPLPHDVAEWMGLDESMVPLTFGLHTADLAG
jgi:hypothetical protein